MESKIVEKERIDMHYEIYCDERCPDLLSSKRISKNEHIVIGGVWIEKNKRDKYKRSFKKIREDNHFYSEVKWRYVSPSRLNFYLEMVDLFFKTGMRFRSIVIKSEDIDLDTYHKSDPELGFYKFYYQLLYHWIENSNSYNIFLDFKQNRLKNRIKKLEEVLINACPSSKIVCVQSIKSKDSIFIQMADMLIGAVGYSIDKYSTSSSKIRLIKRIEEYLKHPIRPTPKYEKKFNIFKIEFK